MKSWLFVQVSCPDSLSHKQSVIGTSRVLLGPTCQIYISLDGFNCPLKNLFSFHWLMRMPKRQAQTRCLCAWCYSLVRKIPLPVAHNNIKIFTENIAKQCLGPPNQETQIKLMDIPEKWGYTRKGNSYGNNRTQLLILGIHLVRCVVSFKWCVNALT